MRRTTRWAAHVLYLAATVLLADYLCHRLYMRTAATTDLPNGRLSALERHVGHMRCDKKSSFCGFGKKKKPGIVRIGCFGDSFTHGDEVDDASDYPSLLQKLFHAGGYGDVEVLNFGMPGCGLHQAFLLWELAGRNYGLDHILLGPSLFLAERDSTFAQAGLSPDGCRAIRLHGRFVLDGAGLRLVQPLGETDSERFSKYFRFIPPLAYIRFDARPPAFLAAPIHWLFGERRTIRNPFYYRQDVDREIAETHRRLLSRLADAAPQVVLGSFDESAAALGKEIAKPNLASVRLYRPVGFPYDAAGGHLSPYGNQLVARQMFDCLTGKPESRLTLLATEPIPRAAVRAARKISLHDLEIAVEIRGKTLARLRGVNAASLLVVKTPDMSPLNADLLTLGFEIREGMPLTLAIRRDGETRLFSLGRAAMMDARVNLGAAFLDKAKFDPTLKSRSVSIGLDSAVFERSGAPDPGDEVAILLGGIPVLAGKLVKRGGPLGLTGTEHSALAEWVPLETAQISIDDLPASGPVTLCLRKRGEQPVRIPIARWKKLRVSVPLDQPRMRL